MRVKSFYLKSAARRTSAANWATTVHEGSYPSTMANKLIPIWTYSSSGLREEEDVLGLCKSQLSVKIKNVLY